MKFISIFLLSIASSLALAHPVSFKDSKGIMGYHSPTLSHNQISYSYQYWGAVGAHHYQRPDLSSDKTATLLSANFLVKRWNESNLQANIYANLGGGHSELTGSSETVGYALVQFDIEDRDYYFLTKHYQIFDGDVTHIKQTAVRAGLTPYVDSYNGFHSWFIMEYQHTELIERERFEDLTPFLRLFYRNLLFEIGQSFDGTTKFNYIMHF